MKRRKITVSDAFDMVPMGGSMLMYHAPAELIAEADKRNARLSGEWYSVAILFGAKTPMAFVTRSQQWATAREDRLLGVVRMSKEYDIMGCIYGG